MSGGYAGLLDRRMIPKGGNLFSDKIMRNENIEACADRRSKAVPGG